MRSWDVGLDYQVGKLKLALGMATDSRRGGLASNEFDDKWQAGVSYQALPGLDVYALGGVDRYRNTSTTRRDVPYTVLGAAYAAGAHKGVVNWMQRDVQTSLTGKRDRWQLSYQYFLSTSARICRPSSTTTASTQVAATCGCVPSAWECGTTSDRPCLAAEEVLN